MKFSVDIAAAYPAEAGVTKWERSYELNGGKSFTISDTYSLASNNGKTELHFMTSNKVERVKDSLLWSIGDSTLLDLQYNPKILSAQVEPIVIQDSRLLQSWPKNINRVILAVNGSRLFGNSTLVFTPSKKK